MRWSTTRASSRSETRREPARRFARTWACRADHWDGNTLVVETTNFKARSAYRNANADTLKLVERFTRTAPDKIEWTVTVDDSTTWSRPWTFSIPLTMNDQEAVLEYACHEGNQAIKNILNAARVAEASGTR